MELSKNRNLAAWILAGMLTVLYLFSASGKLFMPQMAEQSAQWGLNDWRIVIAIGEGVSALLFLFPRTNLYGSFLLSSSMGEPLAFI